MSEYQYYEFQTLDRRLSGKEMDELRALSTRASITPTSFSNEYSFGSFKGNPDAMMEKYFDGFLYLANWGTHELQLRIPARTLPAKTARAYCPCAQASVREKSGNLIFSFHSADEEGGGDWVEGEGLLGSTLQLRSDLITGDLRCLYLGWLGCVQTGELDDDAEEPPVPPDLGKLSGPLSNFADFFRIDPDLLAVAAEASQQSEAAQPDRHAMAECVAALSGTEKDDFLVRILAGETTDVSMDLRSRVNRLQASRQTIPEVSRRTGAEFLQATEAHRNERQRRESQKATEERAHAKRMAAIVREKQLNGLVGREPELWAKSGNSLPPASPRATTWPCNT